MRFFYDGYNITEVHFLESLLIKCLHMSQHKKKIIKNLYELKPSKTVLEV